MSGDLATAFLLATWATATPLLLAALGELVSERGGVLNIGLEGLMLVGAFTAFVVADRTGSAGAAAIAATVAGAVAVLPFALVVVRLRVDAVVAGTAWNLVCFGVTAVGLDLLFGDTGSARLVEPLPRFLLPAVALGLVPLVAVVLARTRLGLRLRACGEDPVAAGAVGIPVARYRIGALLWGGALAAAGGAHLALVESRTFVEEMTAGRGFVALAVVVCGRWTPFGVAGAALLFGAVSALQFQFQASGSAVPYHVFLALPYVATLVVLAGFAGRARGPAGLGK